MGREGEAGARRSARTGRRCGQAARLAAQDAKLLHEFKDALSASRQPDEAAFREEVESTCNVLSQVVVGRWFHALARARQGESEVVSLNAQMLPGDRSFAEVLQGVDFGAYGVEEAEVIAALRRYRDWLEEGFYARFNPIEFGTRLLVVPTRSEEHQPFALFASREAALARAAEEREWIREIGRERLRKQIEEAYRKAVAAIRNALTGRPMQPAPGLVNAAFAAAHTGFATGAPALIARRRIDLVFADDNFAQPVEFGADLLASGWHHGINAAVQPLRLRKQEILTELMRYSEEAHVPAEAAVDMYVHAVAIRAVVPRFGFDQEAGFEQGIEASVAQALDVSDDAAERLVCDAFAGLMSYRRRDDLY